MAAATRIIILAVLLPLSAMAAPVTSEDHLVQIDLPSGKLAEHDRDKTMQVLFAAAFDDMRVTVSRVSYPNVRARRKSTRYFDKLEKAMRREFADAHISSHKITTFGKVPVFDIELRIAKEHTRVRLIAYHRSSLILTIKTTTQARKKAKDLAQTFQPWFPASSD